MANKTGYDAYLTASDGTAIPLRYIDNGDGTWSLAVASGVAGTTISSPLGRQADAASVSAALSTEDVALVGATNETAPASDTAASGLNGRLQRIAQRLSSLLAVFGTGASAVQTQGAAADGATAAGNPVLIGGLDPGGLAQSIAVNASGVLVPFATTITDTSSPNAGASVTTSGSQFPGAAAMYGLGTTNLERYRLNAAATLLASAARTTTTNSADQTNYNHRGLLLTVDVSSAGTGSITPSIQVKDSISGNYKTIWTAAAALTANGTAVYAFYPGANAIGTLTYTELVQAFVGRTWRLVMTHNNANSITYSASADLLH